MKKLDYVAAKVCIITGKPCVFSKFEFKSECSVENCCAKDKCLTFPVGMGNTAVFAHCPERFAFHNQIRVAFQAVARTVDILPCTT